MEPNRSSGLIGLARLFWMIGGPAILFFLAGNITQNANGWMAPTSLAFLVVLLCVVLARRLDPHDAYGELATARNYKLHTIATVGTGLVLWLIANSIGNDWITI